MEDKEGIGMIFFSFHIFYYHIGFSESVTFIIFQEELKNYGEST